MATFDWKGMLRSIAPALATVAGGPLAGVVVKELGDKLLGRADASEDDVAAALAGAGPETLVRLREIDADFRKALTSAGIRLEEIAAADRDSARKRETSVQDWTPRILAYLIVGGFMGMAYMLLMGEAKADSVIAGTVIGYVSAKAEQVASYFFGSSAGSKAKTDALERLGGGK